MRIAPLADTLAQSRRLCHTLPYTMYICTSMYYIYILYFK